MTIETQTGKFRLRTEEATGAVAIAHSFTAVRATRLESVTLHLDAAATTSENLTITLNAYDGAAYDTLLYSLDLSAASTVNLLWQPTRRLYLQPGDAIDIAYTNTDTNTYGVRMTLVEEY